LATTKNATDEPSRHAHNKQFHKEQPGGRDIDARLARVSNRKAREIKRYMPLRMMTEMPVVMVVWSRQDQQKDKRDHDDGGDVQRELTAFGLRQLRGCVFDDWRIGRHDEPRLI
jgi:hypothetical protein